jgi:hypothetical protein
MIPVTKSVPLPQVTPVAADRERALSDLKETIRNDEPHMPLQPIKGKKRKQSTSRSKTSKGKGRVQKKTRRPVKPSKKVSKKKVIPKASRLPPKTIF